METWYKKISRDQIKLKGYSPKYVPETREEPTPQIVISPIIENDEPQTDIEESTSEEPVSISFKNKKEFKNTMLPIYERILSKMGLNTAYAKMLVAQDGLESGWGSKPAGRFNFGGIKGKGSTKRTREVINGENVYINDSFRNFNSIEDYVTYKVNLLNNNRYRAFSGNINNFADRVYKGGYATDPKYSEILKRTINSLRDGGILKFQAGGSGELKPDERSWVTKKLDNLATKYNTSTFANSAPAKVLAGFTPFGLFHYSTAGDTDSAKLAILPGAVGSKEVAKDAVKLAEEGVNLVYKHYGTDLSKYLSGALKWLRNIRKGSIPMSERLEVPKQISKIKLGNPKHDYAFYMDPKTRETILEINNQAKNPMRSGEKAAAKQLLQELVGTKDDLGLRWLSFDERNLFPRKFLNLTTQEAAAKDVYSKLMSYKAEAGIKSSFEKLTENEAKQLFDIGWDANMFYPTTNKNTLQTKETFWKENKDQLLKLFRRVPAVFGAGIVGNELISKTDEDEIIKSQKGSNTKQWVDNWLSQRKHKLKNNAIESGIFALPGILNNPYFRQIKSMNKYSLSKGDLPENVKGTAFHREKKIVISDDNDKSTEVHEWTHALRPLEQMSKISEIINTWGRKLGVPKDEYLDSPSEIYSRLMQLRYNNNLDPTHEYTLEEVKKLREKNHNGNYYIITKDGIYKDNINHPSFPYGNEKIQSAEDSNEYINSENIFERYNDLAIQQLLNDVAKVSKNKDVISAESGIKVPYKDTQENSNQTYDFWNNHVSNLIPKKPLQKSYKIPYTDEQIEYANNELKDIIDQDTFWDLLYSENHDLGLHNVSSTGARGLTQFTEETAREFLEPEAWEQYVNKTRTFEQQIQDIKKLYSKIRSNWKNNPEWTSFGRWKVNLLARNSALISPISNRVWNTSLSDNIKQYLVKGKSTYKDLAETYDNYKLYN